MSKNIVVKLVILIVVAALVYSVFWFFKVGQVEKQISNFISENSTHISSGEIAVSGFPLAQKVTIKDLKFTIPSPLLNKRQAIVKSLEAQAGIFSSDFKVVITEGVTVQDIDGVSANVEFSKEPDIAISINDGRISKFSYQDSGYRILDAEKNVIYAATSSNVMLESTAADDDKITTKITANIKDIEGFDVSDVYKNVFEKKIMEGIKTGEVVLGNTPVDTSLAPTDPAAAPLAPDAVVAAPAMVPSAPIPASAAPMDAAVAVPTPASPDAAALVDPAKTQEIAAAVQNNLVKSNFIMDIEYVLTPNKSDQQAQIPTDPTQIQELPVQYSKAIKVTNVEFSNPLYKILINGEMNSFADDNMPSGSLAIKVEKIDSLIGYMSVVFNQMTEQKTPATSEVQAVDLVGNGNSTDDSYHSFLKKVSANLSPVAKELAGKNAVSKEEIAEFDIRREKNLEFLINETPLREILGKF